MKTVERRIKGLVNTPITVIFSNPRKGWTKEMGLKIIWNSDDKWQWEAKCTMPNSQNHTFKFRRCYSHVEEAVKAAFAREELEEIFNELA